MWCNGESVRQGLMRPALVFLVGNALGGMAATLIIFHTLKILLGLPCMGSDLTACKNNGAGHFGGHKEK